MSQTEEKPQAGVPPTPLMELFLSAAVLGRRSDGQEAGRVEAADVRDFFSKQQQRNVREKPHLGVTESLMYSERALSFPR